MRAASCFVFLLLLFAMFTPGNSDLSATNGFTAATIFPRDDRELIRRLRAVSRSYTRGQLIARHTAIENVANEISISTTHALVVADFPDREQAPVVKGETKICPITCYVLLAQFGFVKVKINPPPANSFMLARIVQWIRFTIVFLLLRRQKQIFTMDFSFTEGKYISLLEGKYIYKLRLLFRTEYFFFYALMKFL